MWKITQSLILEGERPTESPVMRPGELSDEGTESMNKEEDTESGLNAVEGMTRTTRPASF